MHTILHNGDDKYSRLFVNTFGAGNTVIDWYKDEDAREKFRVAYPDVEPSAFPSVLIHEPAYSAPLHDRETGEETGRVNIDARHVLLPMPESMVEVGEYEAAVTLRAAENPPV
ncbi:protein of unknown function [Magnetospirillum sp. XM-1]|uniref:hypothetical protein n=1 Tax=Magnetospirillum sp. XM-1 TaxID=1663591 RepID=UPI00073DBDF6|nr:hypothetical protein [Magnetospirillum sp. XM-1]CUW39668.1 protein of unknown function [Magnetospirillum sp. XM-1]